MPRDYQRLEKKKRQRPPDPFLFLLLRFGFTMSQLTLIWQSEIVQMAYRNYINNHIDQDYFYLIVYEWIEENKFEYGKAKYKLYVAEVIRSEISPATSRIDTSILFESSVTGANNNN